MRGASVLLAFTAVLSVSAQNLDLGLSSPWADVQALAGAHIARALGTASLDGNPAGLISGVRTQMVVSSDWKNHAYHMTSRRLEESLGTTFDWSGHSGPDIQFAASHALSSTSVLAAGYVRRIRSFLVNDRRYVTWSSYFHQKTEGGLDAVVLSGATRIGPAISLGAALYLYSGEVVGRIDGDNHDVDRDKWALLEHRLKGQGLRLGMQWVKKRWQGGFILEFPHTLIADASATLSPDSLYASYLPGYSEARWRLPLVVGGGVAAPVSEKWTLILEGEYHHFDESSIRINLFEYGGEPAWEDLWIWRIALEGTPLGAWPVRLGYAREPQQYYRGEAWGESDRVTSWKDGQRIIRHRFTAGSQWETGRFILQAALTWDRLQWQRTFYTYVTLDEEWLKSVLGIIVTLKVSI